MLRPFFCSCGHVPMAWGGGLCIVLYSFYLAWFRAKLNSWYGTFYDLLGSAAQLTDGGSGEAPDWGSSYSHSNSTSSPSETLQAQAHEQLRTLCGLVGPMVVVSPLVRYLRAQYAFSWRMALIRHYLQWVWPTGRCIEGASQRVQEDTARFAVGLSGAASLVLDTVLSLVVFVPVLLSLGKGIPSPAAALAVFGEAWLLAVAFGSALVGLLGSVVVGLPLVRLEVNNQVVEAHFRRILVLDETGNTVAQGSSVPFETHARPSLRELRVNYRSLYCAFFRLNLWLGTIEQAAVLLPFVLLTPMLFASDPSQRIALGDLVRTTDAFGKVFGALSALADHWSHINEWVSVIHRLRQFERQTSDRIRRGLPAEVKAVQLVESDDVTSSETA
jgi:peptide/bleomycin uptake transporter